MTLAEIDFGDGIGVVVTVPTAVELATPEAFERLTRRLSLLAGVLAHVADYDSEEVEVKPCDPPEPDGDVDEPCPVCGTEGIHRCAGEGGSSVSSQTKVFRSQRKIPVRQVSPTDGSVSFGNTVETVFECQECGEVMLGSEGASHECPPPPKVESVEPSTISKPETVAPKRTAADIVGFRKDAIITDGEVVARALWVGKNAQIGAFVKLVEFIPGGGEKPETTRTISGDELARWRVFGAAPWGEPVKPPRPVMPKATGGVEKVCEKCNGFMVPDTGTDGNRRMDMLRCLNCGNTRMEDGVGDV